jgi:hypothetical protein
MSFFIQIYTFFFFSTGEVIKNILVPDEELLGGLREVSRVQKNRLSSLLYSISIVSSPLPLSLRLLSLILRLFPLSLSLRLSSYCLSSCLTLCLSVATLPCFLCLSLLFLPSLSLPLFLSVLSVSPSLCIENSDFRSNHKYRLYKYVSVL